MIRRIREKAPETPEAAAWRLRDQAIRLLVRAEFEAAIQAVRSTEQAGLIVKAVEARIAELHAHPEQMPAVRPDYVGFDYLAVHDGKLLALRDNQPDDDVIEVTSYEQFEEIALVNGGRVTCSSSLDFPEESTQDQHVIALCNAIRGNNTEGES